MALIEMNADLKKTNELLERLVKVAERWMAESTAIRYGHTTEPIEGARPGEDESVAYATDEETMKRELKALAKQFRLQDEQDQVTYNKEEI